MGQHFTPTHIAELTLCGLRGTPTSILDPMAGHGGFLEQSVKRYPYANIVGVEVDPLPLHAAKLITDGKITLISANVFTWAKERVKDNPSCNFYAIVGNPAYVSYQNLPKVKQHNVHNKETHDYRTYLHRTLEEMAIAKGVILDVAYIFKER